MISLIEGLNSQLERNRELLKFYESIPEGVFGATMIKRAIEAGEKALTENDTVAMIKAFKELESSK
jgi:hypothetical protein